MTLLGFVFMIAYANPFNPLPFMVSIIGFASGLYIVALKTYPKEAKYWREFIIDKLNLLINLSKETIQKTREKRRRKHEDETKEVKEMKKCGWCGEEIKDGEYFTLWNATEDRLIMTICKKCYLEDEKLKEHVRKI